MVANSDSRASLADNLPKATPNGTASSHGHDGKPGDASGLGTIAEFPIAIVGMSCRFGGDATSPSKLWDLCVSGKDSWSPIPETRFNNEAWYDEDASKIGKVCLSNMPLCV